MPTPTLIELLAPARDADIGIEAINHGADAVYIGGPGFGARDKAGNEIADIERLVRHAQRFHARIFVTLNTILRDDELEGARRMVWQLHEAGVDALIVQDMGLLELDLPPIQLHASTQTDIRSPEKARFLQDVGFSQMVLARELTLAQIRPSAPRSTAPRWSSSCTARCAWPTAGSASSAMRTPGAAPTAAPAARSAASPTR
jgi:collagenase-like PrtC family protease